MTDILTHNPIPAPSQAQLAAAELLSKVNVEIARRAGEHIDGWRAIWEHPQATAAEIAAQMNGDAEMVRTFTLAGNGLRHLTQSAGSSF